MLDRTPEGVQRWLEGPPEERPRAPKWTHLVEAVDSLTAQIPPGAQFQMILFDEDARGAPRHRDRLPGVRRRYLRQHEAFRVGRARGSPSGEAGSRVALYVYGDDLAIGQIDGMLQFERTYRDPDTGALTMQINAIALPALFMATGELYSSAPYAMLMRELSLRTGGAFIAPSD